MGWDSEDRKAMQLPGQIAIPDHGCLERRPGQGLRITDCGRHHCTCLLCSFWGSVSGVWPSHWRNWLLLNLTSRALLERAQRELSHSRKNVLHMIQRSPFLNLMSYPPSHPPSSCVCSMCFAFHHYSLGLPQWACYRQLILAFSNRVFPWSTKENISNRAVKGRIWQQR